MFLLTFLRNTLAFALADEDVPRTYPAFAVPTTKIKRPCRNERTSEEGKDASASYKVLVKRRANRSNAFTRTTKTRLRVIY